MRQPDLLGIAARAPRVKHAREIVRDTSTPVSSDETAPRRNALPVAEENTARDGGLFAKPLPLRIRRRVDEQSTETGVCDDAMQALGGAPYVERHIGATCSQDG